MAAFLDFGSGRSMWVPYIERADEWTRPAGRSRLATLTGYVKTLNGYSLTGDSAAANYECASPQPQHGRSRPRSGADLIQHRRWRTIRLRSSVDAHRLPGIPFRCGARPASYPNRNAHHSPKLDR